MKIKIKNIKLSHPPDLALSPTPIERLFADSTYMEKVKMTYEEVVKRHREEYFVLDFAPKIEVETIGDLQDRFVKVSMRRL